MDDQEEVALFDDWVIMDGEARELLYQADVFTTEQLCEKTFSELQDIVGYKSAKCIKELLNDKDYHLKNADGAVAKRKRFKVQM